MVLCLSAVNDMATYIINLHLLLLTNLNVADVQLRQTCMEVRLLFVTINVGCSFA